MKPTQSTNSTSAKRALPLLGTLFLSAFLLLLSCGGFEGDDDFNSQAFNNVIAAYPAPLQDFMRPILNRRATSLSTIYVSKSGGSDATKDGSTREKAYAEAELKTAIDTAGAAASATKAYLVLLGPGTYTITNTLNMKNNVLIAGGIAEDGSLSNTKPTLDGAESTQIFSNTSLDKSAALYGVTITKGLKDGGGGGGMYNKDSSPSLMQITFSANEARPVSGGSLGYGGGMYNDNSSPTLTQVIFSDNKVGRPAVGRGGGMYNNDSAPILKQVIFSGNMAFASGGGMYNWNSAPILTQVTFSNNKVTTKAYGRGGGMYNWDSSPTLTQVTFSGNTAGKAGGAICNNNTKTGPTIVNSIFWGNTAGASNAESQIHILNGSGDTEYMSIHNSVLQGGIAGLSYGEEPAAGAAPANTNTVSSNIITEDPNLTNSNIALYLGAAMMEIPKIQTGSSAIDKGLYIKRSGKTFYYSTDASDWYKILNAEGLNKAAPTLILTNLGGGGFNAASNGANNDPPASAIDLTATDITGTTRRGRPDIGAYEFR